MVNPSTNAGTLAVQVPDEVRAGGRSRQYTDFGSGAVREFGSAAASEDQKAAAARHFEWDAWDVRIYIVGRRESGALEGHADLYRDGAYRCRITTANDHRSEGAAADALEARARAWINDWNLRFHSGDTGFATI